MATVERQTDNLKVAKELLDTEISALECVKKVEGKSAPFIFSIIAFSINFVSITDTEKMLENMSKPLEVAKQ